MDQDRGTKSPRGWTSAARALLGGDVLLVIAFVGAELATFCAVTGIASGPGGILHDNYLIGYPLRILASTAIRNGALPYWDQWTNAGAPLTTLYTGVVFSPITLSLSLFGIYSLKTMVVEFVILNFLGLVGMYLWLRAYCARWPAWMGAAAFALASYMVVQAPISFEGVAGPYMYPWLLLGARQALNGEARGIAVIGLAGWELFTGGYLGTAIIAAQFLVVFALTEFASTREGRPAGARVVIRGALYAVLGVVLWATILGFIWMEMYSLYRFDLSSMRLEAVDPYIAAARIDSVTTLLFPQRVSEFVPDSFGAHYAILYFGTFGVLFAVLAPVERGTRRVSVMLAGFAAVSYAAILSPEWWPGRFFTTWIPFYAQVRFHVWNAGLVVFFLCALGAIGAGRFLVRGEGREKAGAFLALAALAVGLRAWQGSGESAGSAAPWPQCCFALGLMAVAALLVVRRSTLTPATAARIVAFLYLAELGVASTSLVHLGAAQHTKPTPEIVRLNEALKTAGFPPPSNQRQTSAPPFSGQYFSKVPVIYGYQPNMHPAIGRLFRMGASVPLLRPIFYCASPDGAPLPETPESVHVTEYTPSHVEAAISADAEVSTWVWSTPYTGNWKLLVDGKARPTAPNRFGLTAFLLEKGRHVVELSYRPWYRGLGLGMGLGGVLVAAGILLVDARRGRRRALVDEG